jgi:hypothetical protein
MSERVRTFILVGARLAFVLLALAVAASWISGIHRAGPNY